MGTNDGVVSRFEWRPSNEGLEVTRVLELQSYIYQMDWSTPLGLLLVSSTSRTVVCNTKLKTFSEVGKAARNGKFGGCILPNNTLLTARPNQKLWSASVEGQVLQTFNLSDSTVKESKLDTFKHKKRNIFSKLFPYNSQILTWKAKTVYLIGQVSYFDTFWPLDGTGFKIV